MGNRCARLWCCCRSCCLSCCPEQVTGDTLVVKVKISTSASKEELLDKGEVQENKRANVRDLQANPRASVSDSGVESRDTDETRYLLGGDTGIRKRHSKATVNEQDLTNQIWEKGKKKSWSKMAIISFDDGTLRAKAPPEFIPDQHGVKDIIDALKGNTSAIKSNGIKLGKDVFALGRLQKGKAIYGKDNHGSACIVHKTTECILIVVYCGDAAPATRLASWAVELMEEKDL